jgi:predicted  nucleic acid-binding Zn-ribbon protein
VSDAKYLGCETVEEKRAKALAEQTAAEEKYETARDALDAFESAVRHLTENESTRLRRAELRQARQQAYDAMRDAREVVNFTHRVSSAGNRPPRYRPELDRGDWIKR